MHESSDMQIVMIEKPRNVDIANITIIQCHAKETAIVLIPETNNDSLTFESIRIVI